MKLVKKVFISTSLTIALLGTFSYLSHAFSATHVAELNLPEPRSSKLDR